MAEGGRPELREAMPLAARGAAMALERLERLPGWEAAERFCFDAHWQYVAEPDFDHPGFVHTAPVNTRLSRPIGPPSSTGPELPGHPGRGSAGQGVCRTG
jgi:hypothetical protein